MSQFVILTLFGFLCGFIFGFFIVFIIYFAKKKHTKKHGFRHYLEGDFGADKTILDTGRSDHSVKDFK